MRHQASRETLAPSWALAAAVSLAVAAPALAPRAATADTIDVDSRVVSATLYPSSASLAREAVFSAPAGVHEIRLQDLPLGLDPSTLRVAGRARTDDGAPPFEVLGLNHRVEQPSLEPLTDEDRETLETEIAAAELSLRAETRRLSSAEARRGHVDEFRRALTQPARSPRGREGGSRALLDQPADWGAAWGALAAEAAAADAATEDALRAVETLEDRLQDLRRELDRSGPAPRPRSVAIVSIRAGQPVTDGVVAVSYVTPEASWAPLYDMRLEKPENEVEAGQRLLRVTRRAAIRQRTGEDWDGVRLELSTARPSGRLEAPEPPMVEARLRPETPPGAVGGGLTAAAPRLEAPAASARAFEQNILSEADFAAAEPAPVAAAESGALARLDGATVVYQIADPVRAPGDGEVRQVLIGEETALVATVARAAPAQEASAYLYVWWQTAQSPLLPGRASLFRDGAYLGQRTLDYVAPGERKALPFGPADSIAVTYEIEDRSEGERGIFATSSEIRARFAMTARNLGPEAMTVTLFTAQPFTETDDVDVAFVGSREPTETDVEGRRGVLAWTFQLAAGAERRIEYGYDVAWPEDREIELR